jgi:hypothetical protein
MPPATISSSFAALSPAAQSGATRSAQAAVRVAREVTTLQERLLAWLRDPEAPGRALHFAEREARAALKTSLSKVTRACEQLEEAGLLVRLVENTGERHRGWGLRGAVPPRRTLAELLRLVDAAPAPTEAPRPGVKSAAEAAAPLTALTPGQRKDMTSVANLIAEYAPGANGDPARVTTDVLARVVETSDGRRPWKLELEVQEWVDQRAKSRVRPGARWSSADSAAARLKAKSSVKTLLHFAQSIGWLQPGEAPLRRAIHTYAPEWHHVVLRWRQRLLSRSGGSSATSIRVGLNTLALYATRRGEINWRTTDWGAVLDEIEGDWTAGALQRYQYQAVRLVWRRIHVLGQVRALDTSHELRVAIVPHGATTRVAQSVEKAESASEIDFSEWVDDNGVPLRGLVEGAYGLRRWVWYTAGAAHYVAGDTSLPERAYEATYRRRRTRSGVEMGTIQGRLEQVAFYAGWAIRHDGAVFARRINDETPSDTMESGKTTGRKTARKRASACGGDCTDGVCTCGADKLLSLMDGDRITRYCAWRAAAGADGTNAGVAHLRNLLATLRRAAQDCGLIAEKARDAATRALVTRQLDGLNRQSNVIVAIDVDQKLRDCIAINEAWRVGDDDRRYGIEKMVDLRDLVVAQACTAADMTVEQQLEILRAFRAQLDTLRAARTKKHEQSVEETRAAAQFRANSPWRKAMWATYLRRAMLAQFTRKVPLRESALRNLSLSMFKATKGGKVVALWVEGAEVLVHVDKKFTKNGEDYDAAYISRDAAGQSGQEEGAARWLLELWFGAGGGREWFVEQAAKGIATDVVFPININKGTVGHGERPERTSLRMAEGGLSSDWRTMLEEHGDALGIDVEQLRSVQGGLGIHSVRYLFGRYWAAVRGQLVWASEMLHHSDLKVTISRYVGRSAGSVTYDVIAEQATTLGSVTAAATQSAPDAMATLVITQAREIEMLRQQIASRSK